MLCNPLQIHNTNVAMSLPVEFINKQNANTNTIKYPIHVACECENYQIYVDGNFVKQASVVESYLENEWNATKIFIPEITSETPKIIAFHAMGGQFSGFMNGFVMDMNNGADYTKYQEWKCMEFIPSAVPINWYMYDYDDSLWEVSKSFGMNYQNNSYQIFETERLGIHLNAEWLWTQDNAKTNIFCRKKDKHVQTIPATTAAPTTHASVLKTTHRDVPATTHASVLKTTHHVPATTANAAAATPTTTSTPLLKSEVKNIYNIKVIINNIKVSKDIIDKHMFNIFRYLHSVKSDNDDDDKLRRELYNIIKQTHTHIHHHYDYMVDYYTKLLRDAYNHQGRDRDQDQDQDGDDDRSDEYGRDEKGEKGEKKEIFRKSDSRLKKSSKIIESMMKLNHYIKVIEYKIHFIKGETRYNLLQILYSLKKQYQDDMIRMLKYFA
jgi:hypothetical protein